MPSDGLTIVAATPAIAALMRPSLPLRVWRRLAAQTAMGPSFAVLGADRPLAIVGFVPIEAGMLELWMTVPPGFRRLAEAAAVLRLLTRRIRSVFPDRVILARIDDRNLPGQRLAFCGGFLPTDQMLGVTSRRSWVRPPFAAIELLPTAERRAIAAVLAGNMTVRSGP
ncbi:hypothetical protein [Jiella avicenniae]|uniref:Uncharacterized protein n=1 Tax=Jiella avicenniae TaxID=2907202 RepID=A0A9X1NZ86_9HYPH|nr:hypothetical protein [Jiella avicenniae]MCE7026418.1 hypothetical protein [Jiella avicenniae]